MLIGERFNGPDGSGNGGYAAGLVAALLGAGTAQVTLRLPPPLGTELAAARDGAGVRVLDGDRLVAEAVPAPPVTELVAPVPLAEAGRASAGYPGHAGHPFPRCYVCGPDRPAGDGLRVFPGPLPDGRVAAPFTAPRQVTAPVVWAALDCPGGWSVIAPGRPYVLGRITATVRALPAPGQQCVVVGRCLATQGRKARVRTSLYGPGGELLGAAEATWIALPTA